MQFDPFAPMLDPHQAQSDFRAAVHLLQESHGVVCAPWVSRRLDLLRRVIEDPALRLIAQKKIDEMQS